MFDELYIQELNKFHPENDDGNIEYKWRLDTKTNDGIKKIISQMTWRLNEGYENSGIREAHYLLGVYDNGELGNLTEKDLNITIDVFKQVVKNIDVEIITEIKKSILDSYIYYAYIIKNGEIQTKKEKNICVIGDPQSGKTSLISYICYDINIRDKILKHNHEKINGITTDIKKEIIGIKNNKIVNYQEYWGWDDISNNSDYIINIYDIPVINLKTVINYILGILPDYILIISNNQEYSSDVQFYIEFCDFYNIQKIILQTDFIKNYDKVFFNNIFNKIVLSETKKYNVLNTDECLFRIFDYYDIPDKGFIVSGIQINKSFNVGDILNLICPNSEYKIKIKSICKKNINSNIIKFNESGTLCFEILNKPNNKIKLSKNCYITNIFETNLVKTFEFKSNKTIENGEYELKLFNGNINFNINAKIIDNTIEFEKPIRLQDNNIIILICEVLYLIKLSYITPFQEHLA